MTPQPGHHYHKPTARSIPWHERGPILPMESEDDTPNCGWGEPMLFLLSIVAMVVLLLAVAS